MKICRYCGEPSTTSIPVRVGTRPENEKHVNTQADHRKVVLLPVCDNCPPKKG